MDVIDNELAVDPTIANYASFGQRVGAPY